MEGYSHGLPDIYFDGRYGKLYEKIENGTAEIIKFQDENGLILHPFIKRSIELDTKDTIYYDLVTPYGYGGPCIISLTGDKTALIAGFQKKCRNM